MPRSDRLDSWLTCARMVDRRYLASTEAPVVDTGQRLTKIAEMVEQTPHYHRRLEYVHEKHWHAAIEEAHKDYRLHLRCLADLVETQMSAASARQNQPKFQASRGDMIRDLCVLEREFPSVTFDPKEKRLSVTTNDVQLEGLDLGAFKIVLHVDSVTCAEGAYYEIVAVDANCASSNDDVTHPHIQSDQLCEGDAQPAIKMALRQGRLLDFFQIVEQVLQTYNASSAYVTTEDWHGQTCGNCGDTASVEECCTCAGCSSSICDQCVCKCADCEVSVCGNCDRTCDGCSDSICVECSVTCPDCEGEYCETCLTQNERCDSCEKKTKEESNAGSTESTVHGDRLGSVAVPA